MLNAFKKRTKTFYIDDKEKYFRCWWFANKITIKALEVFSPTAISSWIDDIRFQEHDRKSFVEIIGYTMSFVMDRLHKDIEATHGWTNDEWELNIGYHVFLGKAFDQIFGIEDKSEESFVNLLNDYYAPDYNDDYEKFWNITYDNYPEAQEEGQIDNDKVKIKNWEQFHKVAEELKQEDEAIKKQEDQWHDENFNIEKYYVYKMSKKFKISDSQKMIENIQTFYHDIGNFYYNDAFFNLSLNTIKKQLKQMVNK